MNSRAPRLSTGTRPSVRSEAATAHVSEKPNSKKDDEAGVGARSSLATHAVSLSTSGAGQAVFQPALPQRLAADAEAACELGL